MRWEKIHSILGTDSTLVAPARHAAEDRHSHPIALNKDDRRIRIKTDEIEALQNSLADIDVLGELSPRSSLTLRPSDSASNMHVAPASPTVDPRMLSELLAIRAKIKILQEEERELADLSR